MSNKRFFTLNIFLFLIITNALVAQKYVYEFKILTGQKAGFKDGPAQEALLHSPEGICVDKEGNLYITEYRTSIVRKINTKNTVTLLAGTPSKTGFADGPINEGLIDRPHGIAVHPNGEIYFCDMRNGLIRKVDKNGIMSTYSGTAGTLSNIDGPKNKATFNKPEDLVFDSKGNAYIADSYNFTIRKIDTNGIVSTFAGQPGKGGFANGNGTEALFNKPLGICMDKKGNLYVADADYDGPNPGNCLIRKIDKKGNVSTYAGIQGKEGNKDGPKHKAELHRPVGIDIDKKGNIYIADTEADLIRIINKKGIVYTIGGQYLIEKSMEGKGAEAAFFDPQSLCVDAKGTIYIADTHNSKIIIGKRIK
jgi:sugar lactone lactonase YvrE